MTKTKFTVLLLLASLWGFLFHAALPLPPSKRIAYTKCDSYNCQVRIAMPWWTRDVIFYTGPAFSLSLGQDEKGQPIIMQSAENIAYSLSHLVGYGGHWKIK